MPKFNFYDTDAPIYTHARYLPASKITRSMIERAVVAEGCIIMDAKVEHSLIGIRSRIHNGATVKDCVIMGLDSYESEAQLLSVEAMAFLGWA